jgi:hypothetical protein
LQVENAKLAKNQTRRFPNFLALFWKMTENLHSAKPVFFQLFEKNELAWANYTF